MSTLRNAVMAGLVLSALAACSTAPIPEQIAAAPQQTDWLHSQAALLPSNIGEGN